MSENPLRILRAAEASKRYGLTVWTLYRLAAAGKIASVRTAGGRLMGFTVQQLDEFVLSHSTARRDDPAAPVPQTVGPPVFDGTRVFD